MEEAIVSFAIERIGNLVSQEASSLIDVRDQVESLKKELGRMKSFLKDAYSVKDPDERLRNRVKEIRDLAYGAEDVIDSYIYDVYQGDDHHWLSPKRLQNKFGKPLRLKEIGTQVKAIQTQLEEIAKGLTVYGIPIKDGKSSNSDADLPGCSRTTYLHDEEDYVVGLEIGTRDVIALLMKEEDRRHNVVSIVGMGGLGKTTLAKKVCNHIDVKRHFDCCVWVFISQQCLPRDVFHEILVKVLSPSHKERELIDKLKENELVERLYIVLREKLYLVVLDDIWRCEQWDRLKVAFPKGKKGSKLLFTTRDKKVALRADPSSSPVELLFLTEDESWELFKRKALLGNEMESHASSEEFETLGKEMLKKCGGLPLAIVVLGGLLAAKKSLNEWRMVWKSMNAYLELDKPQQLDHYATVKWILALSYEELPFHLKPCFLYIGQFPEDSEISKKELIRLWIAEDFIFSSTQREGFVFSSTQRETCMEDTAKLYVEELLNRSLIHAARRDYTGIYVKTFRMHDLLRDLCVTKSQEEHFLRIFHQLPTNELSHSLDLVAKSEIRRITIHLNKLERVSLKGETLRSFLLFAQGGWINELNISFRFLRVLKLWTNHHCTSYIGEIGHLTLLRYLSLRGGEDILPESFGNLKSLRTFVFRKLSNTEVIKVPNVLFKLKKLRHVLMVLDDMDTQSRCWFEVENPQQLLDTDLENIETLKFFVVRRLSEMKALRKLSNIRKLGLEFLSSEDVRTFLSSLKLDRLQSFDLTFRDEVISRVVHNIFPNLEPLSRCDSLSKLRLHGGIQEDPSSHHCLNFLPAGIVKLTLKDSGMTKDPMIVLEKLRQLRSLTLGYYSYTGTKLCCSRDGFPQLDYLQFRVLPFKEWEIEKGAMPRLRVLNLRQVSEWRMVPEDLKHITTLQQLNFIYCNLSLTKRVQVIDGREGEDYYKVRHIPSITIKESIEDCWNDD